MLGDLLIRLRLYDEAIGAYRAEIDLSTSRSMSSSLSPLRSRLEAGVASVHLLIGDILFALQRTQEAIADYEKGLSIDDGNSSFHHRLALAYYQQGDQDRYESNLQALQEACSNTASQADWCQYYRDIVDRVSQYQSEPHTFYVGSTIWMDLDPIPTK